MRPQRTCTAVALRFLLARRPYGTTTTVSLNEVSQVTPTETAPAWVKMQKSTQKRRHHHQRRYAPSALVQEDHASLSQASNDVVVKKERSDLMDGKRSSDMDRAADDTIPYTTRATRAPPRIHSRKFLSAPPPVVIDSAEQTVTLNRQQEEDIWNDRCETYRTFLKRLVATLQSHHSPVEKCHRILAIHERLVIPHRLRLRADTYEEIFHLFYAVATSGSAASHSSTSATASCHSFSLQEYEDSLQRELHRLTSPFLNPLWSIYRYMIDSGTKPTPHLIQHLLGVLERVAVKNPDVEARAHSLMLDADRNGFAPTDFSLTSYANICSVNGVMHLAVARAVDVWTRHEAQPCASVCACLLTGMTKNGQHKEALKFIGTWNNVPITLSLLHSILHAARCSHDPVSAFSYYEAVMRSGIKPSPQTFCILLDVIINLNSANTEEHHQRQQSDGNSEKSNSMLVRDKLRWLLRESVKRRVRLDYRRLNKILALLADVGDREAFQGLLKSMRKHQAPIFEETLPHAWLLSNCSSPSSETTVARISR